MKSKLNVNKQKLPIFNLQVCPFFSPIATLPPFGAPLKSETAYLKQGMKKNIKGPKIQH